MTTVYGSPRALIRGARFGISGVGDFERALRISAGIAGMLLACRAPRLLRWPLRAAALATAATGAVGWCPCYAACGVTSLGGPGDRPDEDARRAWLRRASG